MTQADAQILAALGGHSSNGILILRMVCNADGDPVDAEVVWCNDLAMEREPTLRPGVLASELTLGHLGDAPSASLVMAAWNEPDRTHERPPFPVTLAGTEYWFEAAATRHDELVVLSYIDRTREQMQVRDAETFDHRFRELLVTLDAGVVLLRPIWGDDIDGIGRFEDAEIVWANEASKHMWKDQEGLAPGTRVASVYYDAVDWLDHANLAWRGVPQNRILQADPAVAYWTSAQLDALQYVAAGGGKVLIADVNAELGTRFAAEIGAGARFVRCDVTSEADAKAAVDAIKSARAGDIETKSLNEYFKGGAIFKIGGEN